MSAFLALVKRDLRLSVRQGGALGTALAVVPMLAMIGVGVVALRPGRRTGRRAGMMRTRRSAPCPSERVLTPGNLANRSTRNAKNRRNGANTISPDATTPPKQTPTPRRVAT